MPLGGKGATMKIGYRVIFISMVIAGVIIWRVVLPSDRPSGSKKDKSEFERSGALQALELWTQSRSYPEKDIPASKYFQAFQYAKHTMKELPRKTNSLEQWKSIGPTNFSGRILSVAVNPLNPNTIYAGSASGGLWQSHTGGTGGDWQRIRTGYPVLGVGAIAIDPNDTSVMYVGTGEVYRYQNSVGGIMVRTTRGSYGMGILKTTDAGLTWGKSLDWSANQQRGVEKIVFNPMNSRTVWAATTEGIYKSVNSGTAWARMDSSLLVQDIVVNTADSNKAIASCGNFGLYPVILRTTNNGATWNDITFTLFTGKVLLELSQSKPNTVYASVADSTFGPASLWQSTDFGSTWFEVNNSVNVAPQGWYAHFVAAHPTDTNKIIHAGVNMYKSTNGGGTFSGIANSSVDYHAYAHHPTDPNTLYAACDFGLFRTTDFGSTFTPLNDGLLTTQFYSGFSNSTTDSNLAVGSIQDDGAPMYSGGTSWGGRYGVGESGWKIIDPTNDSIIYSAADAYFFKSTDRGASNNFIGPFSSFMSWNLPCILSPSLPSRLYLGMTTIYKSTDAGANWTSLGSLDGNPALTMAISQSNPDTLYVGTAPLVGRPHVFRTTNGGTNWTDITGPLPDRYLTDLAIDPSDARTLFVTAGGFGSGHVYKSTNAGGTWSDKTGSLPDIPASAVMIDPYNAQYVYLGNDLGAFASTDGGSTWFAFSEGLPEAVIVSDLTYSPSNDMIRLATHGNGVYQHKRPGGLPSLSVLSPNGGESWEAGTAYPITWTGDLVSLVNLQYSTDNGGSWLSIVDSIPAALPSYNWIVPKTLTSSALVRVEASSNVAINDQSNAAFTIYFGGSIVPVEGRWNLLSVPVSVADPRKTTLFPSAASSAYAYENGYAPKDTLLNGLGYWLRYNAPQLASLKGNSILEDTINVSQGWNLMGSIGSPIAASSITSIPPAIVTSEIFGYNGTYVTADSLQPGYGYWINASQAGELILSAFASASPSARIRIVPANELPPPAPSGDFGSHSKPLTFELLQNYPNPFNPSTKIQYSIPSTGMVSVRVYDVTGKEVAALVNEVQQAGTWSARWDAGMIASGVYLYQITFNGAAQARKMLLLR
jgi:photosystem II stability/assembly factor-like uncharacterized protein